MDYSIAEKSWRESVDILLATAWRGYAAIVAVHCVTYNRFFYASLHRLFTPARIRLHNLTFNGLVIKLTIYVEQNICQYIMTGEVWNNYPGR
jgi:hypothetical protein